MSLFNQPSLFSPFGTSPFHALQDHGSSFSSTSRGGTGLGRTVSTNIQMINGKTTKTTRIVENGQETVTVEENGVETSRRVNGVPIGSGRQREALPSSQTSTHHHHHHHHHGAASSRSRQQQVPSLRVIPTTFQPSAHHHHHPQSQSHSTSSRPGSSSSNPSHGHKTRIHHSNPIGGHGSFNQHQHHSRPAASVHTNPPTLSHISHLSINPNSQTSSSTKRTAS